jgi:FlaA1/EpsC-like NDP-sugar epimerase
VVGKTLGHFLERHRTLVQVSLDCLSWAIAVPIAIVLRYEFEATPSQWGPFTTAGVTGQILLACIVQCLFGLGLGLYRGHWRYGSFDEVAHLVRSTVVVTVCLAVVNAVTPSQLVPMSVVFLSGVIALVLMAAARYIWRLVLERRSRPNGDDSTRVLVFGAGQGGVQLLSSMLRNPNSRYLPVALLDDDPAKSKLRIMGVPVVGDRTAIEKAARDVRATTLVIAVPSADSELVRDISERGLAAGLTLAILPPMEELLDGIVGVADLRPVTEADLLGRHVIDTDLDSIAGYLTGKRVLITGAGGSIGSELCHQISRFAPTELVMLDRDESALHGVQLRIEGRALLDSRNLVVCDIRDLERLHEVFSEHRPDVVFHAAALKHLPLLEMHPKEAVKTNVVGTQNVLEAARRAGVQRVINISTDKAADPSSVLGFSKRVAERLTATMAQRTGLPFVSVRFGNVLGSRGSVLTAFRAQIEAGGPVTVTHPDVTRYFMTVEEAVELVVQAGAVGMPGQVLILDMGQAVRIDDVARRMTAQAARPVEIVYTGLRPGEKLHEVLLGNGERDVRPAHPLISQVPVQPLDYTLVSALTESAQLSDADMTAMLANLCNAPVAPSPGGGAGGLDHR